MNASAFQIIKAGSLGLLRYLKVASKLWEALKDGAGMIMAAASWVFSPFIETEEFGGDGELALLSRLFVRRDHWMMRLYDVKTRNLDPTLDSVACTSAAFLLLGHTLHYVDGHFIMITSEEITSVQHTRCMFTVTHRRGLDVRALLLAMAPPEKNRGIGMYRIHKSDAWYENQAFAPFESTFLEPDVKAQITQIFERFTQPKNREEFERLGQPNRIVILLHGVPGTGKTRLVGQLAAKYGTILVVYPTGQDAVKSLAASTRRYPNAGAFLLFDEFDKLFAPNTSSSTEVLAESSKIAKLSSFLDGMTSPMGVVIFLVANDITMIPPVVQRARRVHHTIRIDEFSSTLLAEAVSYWSKGKVNVTVTELAPYHKKFTGASVIEILEDLSGEGQLTKERYLQALDRLLKAK